MPRVTGFARVPIPGPAPTALLGHLPQLARFFDDPVGGLTRLRTYGDVVAVSRDNPAMVCVFGPERNREVLTSPRFLHDEDFIKGPPGTALGRMSRVIVCINGEDHRRHRRLMLPAFGRASLPGYADETVRVAEALVARWPLDEAVDLDALLRDLALSVAVRSLFGLDVLAGATALGEVACGFVKSLTSPLAILLPYALPGTPYRRAQRLGSTMIAQLEALIAEKRRRGPGGDDALALLLRAVDDEGTGFTDEELVAETVTLFIAGHETMAKTLSWTMFLLERHPDALEEVLDELARALGGRPVTAADLDALPRLDRAVKESMRLLPAVPTLFFRVPDAEATVGSVTLPRGANVIVSPFATHHDPALYPEPRRFDPTRWEGAKRSPYEYMPFGAGPRVCIGASFAQQTIRLVLATVLQRVRARLAPGAEVSRLTRANILTPRYGLPARLSRAHRERLAPAPLRGDIGEIVALD